MGGGFQTLSHSLAPTPCRGGGGGNPHLQAAKLIFKERTEQLLHSDTTSCSHVPPSQRTASEDDSLVREDETAPGRGRRSLPDTAQGWRWVLSPEGGNPRSAQSQVGLEPLGINLRKISAHSCWAPLSPRNVREYLGDAFLCRAPDVIIPSFLPRLLTVHKLHVISRLRKRERREKLKELLLTPLSLAEGTKKSWLTPLGLFLHPNMQESKSELCF